MDAAGWNERYATPGLVWHAEPNRFLPPEVADLTPGSALDLACGEGRNAVWLAEQGWQATGVDFSDVGLAKASAMAADRGVAPTWVCADVCTWEPPQPGFDLVVVFYLQLPAAERRQAMHVATRALTPGGTVLWVAHDLRNLTEGVGGPQHPDVLCAPDDLVADVAAVAPEVVVERAERVHRDVEVEGERRQAIDCLLRARRPA